MTQLPQRNFSYQHIDDNFRQVEWDHASLSLLQPSTSQAYSPLGNFACIGDADGVATSILLKDGHEAVLTDAVRLFNTGSRVSGISINPSAEFVAAISNTSNDIAFASISNSPACFDKSVSRTKLDERTVSVSFMQDDRNGQNVILLGTRKGLRMIDCSTGAEFRKIEHRGGVTSMHSWQGCMVAAGSFDGGVSLFDVRSKQEIAHFAPANDSKRAIFGVDCSARVLCTVGSQPNSIRLFDMQHRKMIVQKTIAGAETIKSVAFSPKRRLLLIGEENRLSLCNFNEIPTSTLPVHCREVVAANGISSSRWNPKRPEILVRFPGRELLIAEPRILQDSETGSV